MHRRKEKVVQVLAEKSGGNNHLEILGIDGIVMLKWILDK
jgi:hypothetical protein